MQVRLESDRMAGGAYQQAGQVVDLPDAEARPLIRAGLATIETAAKTAPENAATRTAPPNQKRRREQR